MIANRVHVQLQFPPEGSARGSAVDAVAPSYGIPVESISRSHAPTASLSHYTLGGILGHADIDTAPRCEVVSSANACLERLVIRELRLRSVRQGRGDGVMGRIGTDDPHADVLSGQPNDINLAAPMQKLDLLQVLTDCECRSWNMWKCCLPKRGPCLLRACGMA